MIPKGRKMKTRTVKSKPKFITKRKFVLFLFDLFCFFVIDALYYLLSYRASGGAPVENLNYYLFNTVILSALIFAARFISKVYSNVWRYTNTFAYMRLVVSDCIGGVLTIVVSRLSGVYIGIWHAVTVASLTALCALSARFCYRIIYKHYNIEKGDVAKTQVAIVGAGQLGALLAGELKENPNSKYNPLFFVDTDREKIGQRVVGLTVFDEKEAKELADKYAIDEFIIAISKLTSDEANEIYERFVSMGRKVKIYDSPISEDGDGMGSTAKRVVRDFSIEDLLFRKEYDIEDAATVDFYNDKTVLVTGGGGSIGSELCRQIAKCGPKKLVLLDIYENNAYDIQQELIRKYENNLDLCVEIASVRDRQRLDSIFSTYRPDVVFHAAAHKHVPLMEHSACEAIKNNVIGTYNTADMAEKYGASKFILISTDKAVNPTNIMGASKRICEMVVQCRKNSTTSFAAVRFGNVLGSNGSVIPLFKKQIAAGGPITITDKRIIRYFMTIPEATQLVMQAGAMARSGELFVLNMGKPIKIYDLAVNMIKLSGLVPEKDICIKEIGLRPGEKLYEELLMKSETLDKTSSEMIFVEKDAPLTRREVDKKLDILSKAVDLADNDGDMSAVRRAIIEVVPTFKDAATVNKNADKSDEMKQAEEAVPDAV